MSKVETKRTILTEIEDTKRKLHLIESDKKAYGENLDDALSDCKKRIQELRKENSKLRKQLFERLKSDEHIINEAFQRNVSERAMFSKRTCSEALETLNYKVCGKVKHLNLLKYLTEIKCLKLKSRETQCKNLEFDVTYVNDTLAGVNQEGQKLRSMENRLDKATLKYGEAGQINKVYVQIIYKLQEEHLHYGNNLDALEKEISDCKKDLCNLLVMKTDAEMARDAAINDLHNKEEIVYQEKKKREKELNYMRQVAENCLGHSDKLDKRAPTRESNILGSSIQPLYMQEGIDEQNTKMIKFEECYKLIQDLSGVLNLQEAVVRFKNQNNTEIHLRKMIDELEKQNIKFLKQRNKVNIKLNKEKYERETKEFNNEETILSADKDLRKKEIINKNLKRKLSELNITLALCKLSIEHINEILPPLHSNLLKENIQKCNFRDFIIDLFNNCEIVSENLMIEINQIEDIKSQQKLCFPPVLETYNEFFTAIIKHLSINNTRVCIASNLRSIQDDEDHESGEDDNNVPSRRALKKQAFQFVEAKTKKITKKKKKTKEK